MKLIRVIPRFLKVLTVLLIEDMLRRMEPPQPTEEEQALLASALLVAGCRIHLAHEEVVDCSQAHEDWELLVKDIDTIDQATDLMERLMAILGDRVDMDEAQAIAHATSRLAYGLDE